MECCYFSSIVCKSRLNVDGTILVSLKTFYKAYNDGLPQLLSEVIFTKKCTVEFQKKRLRYFRILQAKAVATFG